MYSGLRLGILPQLIPSHSTILTAVSGGPDSVALAHILWRYIKENQEQGLRMVISHVNHRVRKESAEEAKMVARLADIWNVPFILHEFDAVKNAVKSQKSFQEASREWRYARWKEDRVQYGCDLIATGHHLGDQAETVLYRMIRGSGTAGLAGIYPESSHIIRPLLTVSKEEIVAYCDREELPYAMDKSNREPHYDRNRIRLELLPILEAGYNDKIQEALGRMAEILRWDEEYISSQVDMLWPQYCRHTDKGHIVISLEAWDLPEAILSRLLRRSAMEITGEPRGLEYKFVDSMMKQGRKIGWRQDLPGIQVETKRNGFFFFRRQLEQEDDNAIQSEVELQINQWIELPEIGVKVGIFREKMSGLDSLWCTEFEQQEVMALETPLTCRTRRPGDRIFLKKIGHKALKKVFQEKGIPSEERNKMPVLAASQEGVIWVPGVCRSGHFLPKDTDSPRLYGIVIKI